MLNERKQLSPTYTPTGRGMIKTMGEILTLSQKNGPPKLA